MSASLVTDTFELQGQVVLILCGLVASGKVSYFGFLIHLFVDGNKSTFARHLQRFFPQFRVCNQDDLGQRRYVEQLARESLSEGFSVCIDRTNIDAV